MKHDYKFFDRFVFRTPLYEYNRGQLKLKKHDPAFKEALFLASPDFFKEWKNAAKKDTSNPKIQQSSYKYLTRATTRCTPFGLFASCSVGNFSDAKDEIILSDKSLYSRVTRLDMNYLCALVQYLETLPEIQEHIKYFPNDSIYSLGGTLRYVEYYYAGSKRIHRISSVDSDEYLMDLLTFSTIGRTISELVDFLKKEDIEESEAHDYIMELISSQLLKSELEMQVTGNDSFDRIISQVKIIPQTDTISQKLLSIKKILNIIDNTPLGKSIDQYQEIISIVKDIGIPYEIRYLFQTDLFKPVQKAILNNSIKEDLLELISFLSKITPINSRTYLSEFRKAFSERYEDREMPLPEVLDSELGIGFLQGTTTDIPNELLRGVFYKGANFNIQPESRTNVESILFKKFIDSIRTGDSIIRFNESDFKNINTNTDDLPSTMHLMCSIVGNKVHVKSLGNTCGANLLGRFCHLNPAIESLAREITSMDQKLNPNVILAEIVHLPESRTGNILFRPVLRDYEIHYLASSAVDSDFQIPISDLLISLRANRIILRSKRLDKEIIPRLTNAHNFSYDALPVYHFLCEMQSQNQRIGLFWDSGNTFSGLEHKPRIEFKRFILAREQWLIKEENFPKNNAEIHEYLVSRGIPECIVIAENDNELYIDFNDEIGVELFLTLLKKRKVIWIEEFLFDEQNSPVKNESGFSFCNEFIFACHKN